MTQKDDAESRSQSLEKLVLEQCMNVKSQNRSTI